eukprot:3618339-Ditylum_brightwellii.AAC.1
MQVEGEAEEEVAMFDGECNWPSVLANDATEFEVGSISIDIKGLGEVREVQEDLLRHCALN